ncbi:MAG: beta-propeller fold lactonase family protein, partial [Gammaproteobacteria bacterium]|nr:beta-propeller fold lactonase family protein [Gammaproteobacteria bacterium]
MPMIFSTRNSSAIILCSVLLAAPQLVSASTSTSTLTLFESGQVRPLAMSRDGKYLYAVNTPDAKLEVFSINSAGIEARGSVSVGLEPVAVAVRNENEVWVVNHLSDSVSVVDVHETEHPRITRTLLVGDEPRDILFAGKKHDRAFITTAHRGQNNPNDPQLTTPGIGRADVWVFDANHLGTILGGTPLTIITLFTDTPRALAATPDGTRVYVAGFFTGNRTTTIAEGTVPDGGEANGGLPATRVDAAGESQPETGLIVQFNGQHWVDELGRSWDDKVRFNLPDKDVFAIDATANPPKPVDGSAGFYSGVGTVLF